MTRLKSPSDVDRIYSPAHWEYAVRNPGRAYMADCPTVADIAASFGAGYSEMWVRAQVLALYGTSPNRDKAAADGIKVFAGCFAAQVKPYKLSELMLFFARYKAGMYDESYATFDTRRIGNAFFHRFLPQRAREIDAIERKQAVGEVMKRREMTVPEGYDPYTWYLERVRRGEIRSYGNLAK